MKNDVLKLRLLIAAILVSWSISLAGPPPPPMRRGFVFDRTSELPVQGVQVVTNFPLRGELQKTDTTMTDSLGGYAISPVGYSEIIFSKPHYEELRAAWPTDLQIEYDDCCCTDLRTVFLDRVE